MTTRGRTIKQETPQRTALLRPMVTRRYELVVDHGKCCGCEICMRVCPREAIKLTPPETVAGRLARRPRVEIDAKLCSFCGECVVVCPTHALDLTVNGQPEIPVVKGEAFPLLLRSNRVDLQACQASTDTSYVERCPVGAIAVDVERDAQGHAVAVRNVTVDRKVCIGCTRCMEEGPRGGFTVVKPYQGRISVLVALCPEGCQSCVDVCPTRAISYDGQQVWVDRRFCFYCGACQVVCPVPGAMSVQRTAIRHTPIQSAAWMTALSKLVSFQEVSREYDVKGQTKRRQAVVNVMRVKEEEQSEAAP